MYVCMLLFLLILHIWIFLGQIVYYYAIKQVLPYVSVCCAVFRFEFSNQKVVVEQCLLLILFFLILCDILIICCILNI